MENKTFAPNTNNYVKNALRTFQTEIFLETLKNIQAQHRI